MRAPRPLQKLFERGTGAAVAVLAPRAASFGVQWLLALAAGPAALAAFVTMTSRGAVAVSLVSAGLAPTLMQRPRALRSRGGRALIGCALLSIATLAFGATALYEATLGLGGTSAFVVAVFSGCALFASTAPAVWPMWQMEGRYLHVMAAMLACSPAGAALAALGGRPAVACLAIGVAGAMPGLLLVRPTRVGRAVRYAVSLIRRAAPLSLASFATSVVFPAALSAGKVALGDHVVGQQVLFWSFMVALSIASQSFASRAIAGESRAGGGEAAGRVRAFHSWLRAAVVLAPIVGVLYVVFTVRIPGLPWTGAARAAMSPALLVSGVAPLITDPICFYFSGSRSNRLLAVGSVAAALAVAAGLLLAPSTVVSTFGVFGPSAFVGVLRLALVRDAPLRWAPYGALLVLLLGYAVAVLGADG